MATGFSSVLFPSTTVSAAGTTDKVPGIPGIRGAYFFFHISAATGTAPTITPAFEVWDPASNTWSTPYSLGAITATPGMTTFLVYPSLGATSLPTYANTVLPPNFRIAWAIGGTGVPTVTFSIGASYLP